jgi:hypothetical protein
MAKKKKLKINGSKIVNFDVSIRKQKDQINNSMVDFIFLTVETNDDVFKYRIGRDATNPDLNFTENHIKTSLIAARSDYSNVEITEDSEMNRLFYEVQGLRINTYPGRRL